MSIAVGVSNILSFSEHLGEVYENLIISSHFSSAPFNFWHHDKHTHNIFSTYDDIFKQFLSWHPHKKKAAPVVSSFYYDCSVPLELQPIFKHAVKDAAHSSAGKFLIAVEDYIEKFIIY